MFHCGSAKFLNFLKLTKKLSVCEHFESKADAKRALLYEFYTIILYLEGDTPTLCLKYLPKKDCDAKFIFSATS